jgi:phospholipase C
MDDSKLGRFDHLVVVMFENRSFDNVLGYLYEPGEVPEFDGVAGTTWSNPVPRYINDGHDEVTVRMSGSTEADMSNPNPDPGEEYQHVNTQLFNIVCPSGLRAIPGDHGLLRAAVPAGHQYACA